jgi:hypothetical protein
MTSCDDFLDKQEDEQLTFDKIWLARSTTQQYWLNAMSYLPDENDVGGFGGAFLGSSDECSMAWDRNYRMMNFGTWNASSIPFSGDTGIARYYNGIRECNIFLQNADRCSDPLLTKDQLAQWKIQARFMRAYYYYMMIRIYGPVFLLGDELIDFSASTEALYRPRNTWDQCVDYVVSEMEACIASPDMKETWTNDMEYGLANKWVCQAVISRLLLYSARPLFNGSALYKNVKNPAAADFPELSGKNLFPVQPDAGKWLKAAEAAYKIINSGKYSLYRAGDGKGTTFKDYCANYYGITKQADWNSEIIWSNGYKGRYNWGVSTVPTSVAGTAYGAVGPTQQQVDTYPMNKALGGRFPITGYDKAGSPLIDLKSGYDVNEFAKTSWSYPCSGWSTQSDFSITALNMYRNRDARFYVTVFFGGNEWIHGTAKTLTSFAKNANGNKSHDYPKPGYLVNRFYDHTLNSADGNWGNIVFPTFRLAEFYLNFIEAVLECKRNSVSLPAGYENEAKRVWADLRDRVGLPSIFTSYPEYSWDANVNELIELYRMERRVELAFERHRYFDTRTWMIATETDGGPMWGMDTTCLVEGAANSTPEGFWKRTVFETRVFNDNHYLFPFAQRELDRNKLLTQNYGW